MLKERIFQAAFIISLIVHGAIFLQAPHFDASSDKAKKDSPLVISYIKQQSPVPQPQNLKIPLPKTEPLFKLPENIGPKKRTPPPYPEDRKDSAPKLAPPKPANLAKPALTKPDVISIKKKISIPPVAPGKINDPVYINYYQIVREKIKRCAYESYSGTETGEVSVSFVISSDGQLKNLRLVEDKSAPSDTLRQISSESIRNAAPFPSFPKELDYPQLSFNLTITYEIE